MRHHIYTPRKQWHERNRDLLTCIALVAFCMWIVAASCWGIGAAQ